MLAGQDFVAGLCDQPAALIVKPLAVVVCDGGGFLQDSVGRNHFTGNQVLPDAEMLERTLGLSTPEFIGRHFDDAEAVGLLSHIRHLISPECDYWCVGGIVCWS